MLLLLPCTVSKSRISSDNVFQRELILMDLQPRSDQQGLLTETLAIARRNIGDVRVCRTIMVQKIAQFCISQGDE